MRYVARMLLSSGKFVVTALRRAGTRCPAPSLAGRLCYIAGSAGGLTLPIVCTGTGGTPVLPYFATISLMRMRRERFDLSISPSFMPMNLMVSKRLGMSVYSSALTLRRVLSISAASR